MLIMVKQLQYRAFFEKAKGFLDVLILTKAIEHKAESKKLLKRLI